MYIACYCLPKRQDLALNITEKVFYVVKQMKRNQTVQPFLILQYLFIFSVSTAKLLSLYNTFALTEKRLLYKSKEEKYINIVPILQVRKLSIPWKSAFKI